MTSIPLPDSPVNSAPPSCPLPGNVKWFSDAKGYGFLEALDGSDVFVHYSIIEGEGFKTLREGQSTEYQAVQTPKGWQATWVRSLGQG